MCRKTAAGSLKLVTERYFNWPAATAHYYSVQHLLTSCLAAEIERRPDFVEIMAALDSIY